MLTVCQVDDSHEMLKHIFLENFFFRMSSVQAVLNTMSEYYRPLRSFLDGPSPGSLPFTCGTIHAERYLLVYANTKGPDQLAYLHSLIRAFAVCLKNHWIQHNV